MTCRLTGAKPLSEPMLECRWFDPWEQTCEILIEIYVISFKKMHLQNVVWKMAAILLRPQCFNSHRNLDHYSDVIMGAMASQITCLTIVYSVVYSGTDQRKHQSSAPLAFLRGIHRGPVNSPHKGPITRKMFPFDDLIMWKYTQVTITTHVQTD